MVYLFRYQFWASEYYSGFVLVLFLLPFLLQVFHKGNLFYVVVSHKYIIHQALS